MPELPRLNCALLVRTDFTSDSIWREVRDQALRGNEEGFQAYLEPVSDPLSTVFPGMRSRRQYPPTHTERRYSSSPTLRRSPRRTIRCWSWICWTTAGARSGASRRNCGPSITTSTSRTWTGRISQTRPAKAGCSAASPPSLLQSPIAIDRQAVRARMWQPTWPSSLRALDHPEFLGDCDLWEGWDS